MYCSMLPLLIMASFHLRLKESTKLSFYGPSNTISFFMPTLDYMFAVRQNVSIDPYAFIDNELCNLFGLFIFLSLRSLDLPPESLRASVGVLAESASTDSET